MSAADIAKTFAAACREGRYEDAEKLWSDDIVSREAMDGPMRELRGREAVHGKAVWWFDNHTIHKTEVEGPFVHGDQFALIFRMDVTNKESKQRFQMSEVGLYAVRGGKVAEETFMPAS